MARKSKRIAERTDGENEVEEVVARTTRSNVARKRGWKNEDLVRGGQAGKRAIYSAPRDDEGRHPKRAKKVGHEIGSSGPQPRNGASPSRLFVLNSGLEDIQKVAIGGISFGVVLDIGTRTTKGDLVKFVTKCYDPELSQPIIPDRGRSQLMQLV